MDIRHCATKFDSVFNVCAEEKEKDFLLLAYLYLVGNEWYFDIKNQIFCGLFNVFAGVIDGVFYDTWKGVCGASIAHFATKFGGLFSDT